MSPAYASALDISFEVRGGLFIRQIHHWAALLFMAAMVAHMCRTFFTGAFRKPREANWIIGVLLLFLGFMEGFIGYSLPDDLLSGTGLRIASGFILSVPVIGTWTQFALFGGEFPGIEIIPRFYIVHVLLIPGILLALIAVHVGLVWYQKHTQFPGPGRTENNVVGVRILPAFAAKGGAFFAVTFGVIADHGRAVPDQPDLELRPVQPVAGLRRFAAGLVHALHGGDAADLPGVGDRPIGDYTIPPAFWASPAFLPVLYVLAGAYPWIERRFTKDNALHNLLQRPRDVPVRTSLGAMAIAFYTLLVLCGSNDLIAYFFDISLNATTWAGRIGVLVVPPIVYYVTYRICIGLQRSDRAVLEHGIETGIIKRLPHGEFIEVHQPLAGVDGHGHPIPLEYQGAPVPKRMNQLGMGGSPRPGSLLTPDPVEETAALEQARADGAAAEAAEAAQRNGGSSNGHGASQARSEERKALTGSPDSGRHASD